MFGRPVRVDSPLTASKLGLAFLTEDRKALGLFQIRPVSDNIILAAIQRLFPRFWIDARPRAGRGAGVRHAPPDPDPQPEPARPVPVRREPAEGGPGQVAGHARQALHPGRAHPGHRRGGQAGNPPSHGRVGGPGHANRHDLLGDAGDPGHERSHLRHEGWPDRRRVHPPRGESRAHPQMRGGRAKPHATPGREAQRRSSPGRSSSAWG